MSTNKFIFYILYNKGIIINLYKLHFPSFPFFPTKQKSFPLSHFSTPLTKYTKGKTKYFSSFHNFSSIFSLLKPNEPLVEALDGSVCRAGLTKATKDLKTF